MICDSVEAPNSIEETPSRPDIYSTASSGGTAPDARIDIAIVDPVPDRMQSSTDFWPGFILKPILFMQLQINGSAIPRFSVNVETGRDGCGSRSGEGSAIAQSIGVESDKSGFVSSLDGDLNF